MPKSFENPDLQYLDSLNGVEFEPVFIIGPHRSGTTILYKILLETGCFNGVTAYYIVNQHRLLSLHFQDLERQARAELMEVFESLGLKDRDFDSMKVTPDIPEEYCFALEHQGRRPILSKRNLGSFTRFCKKLQIVQQPSRPLLLKNPFDTLNFVNIHKAFPHAKFLFIYRNPAEVINSQLKGIRSVLKKKNEYVALVWKRYRQVYENQLKLTLARWIYCGPLSALYHQVSWNIARNCDYVFENVGAIGKAACGVTYRELCQEPNETVRRILKFVGVREKEAIDYDRFIQPRESALLPEVQKHHKDIQRRNERYCRRFGV